MQENVDRVVRESLQKKYKSKSERNDWRISFGICFRYSIGPISFKNHLGGKEFFFWVHHQHRAVQARVEAGKVTAEHFDEVALRSQGMVGVAEVGVRVVARPV